MAATRERMSQAWRSVHEALFYAADATGCAQFIQYADLQARRGDVAADIASLRCMHRSGRLAGDEIFDYARLEADHTAIAHTSANASAVERAEEFIAAARALEVRLWLLVPDAGLPADMRGVVMAPGCPARLVRRGWRGDDLIESGSGRDG